MTVYMLVCPECETTVNLTCVNAFKNEFACEPCNFTGKLEDLAYGDSDHMVYCKLYDKEWWRL